MKPLLCVSAGVRRGIAAFVMCIAVTLGCMAQDASLGAIRGTVADGTGARIAKARVTVTDDATGVVRRSFTNEDGEFVVQLLSPGTYEVEAGSVGMMTALRNAEVEVGGTVQIDFRLALQANKEVVHVSGDTPLVETQPSTVSSVIAEQEINDLPLNGRRFTDLALLSPGVTQDPRGLTSASNGDLSFGGIRGFQTSFLVDGADDNNSFFGQARGRYRAPYQFSNEVVQEFRVSSNTFGAELGRSGGAVINVVTKSGTNRVHGSAFYYLRDNHFNAQPAYTDVKPHDRQQQFGGTIGGPLKRDKVFWYAGYDQHMFHVPAIVHFLNGTNKVTPQPEDYEDFDYTMVETAAKQLSKMGGGFPAALLGNTGLVKLDWNLSNREYLNLRLNTSRYYGSNNVFFDPASPITTFAMNENGSEWVGTETGIASLTSAWSNKLTSHLRVQFSNDIQRSTANSEDVRTRIYDVIDAFGRSSIMPRDTREHRLQVADTFTLEGARHSWKFGGDAVLTHIRNYFPMLFGGEYIFSDVDVNPWTFAVQKYGLTLTPLRAYAHGIPRYYTQNFGTSVSHPNSDEYAWFVQDTARVTDHLALTLGMRYDLQTFASKNMVPNPLWPGSGTVPMDTNNFAPRVAFAYSLGESHPFVFRGGYGVFYTRVPQIYNSAVETDNGINQSHLYLDVSDYWDGLAFPAYPNPLISCPSGTLVCTPPASVAGNLTTEVSAFSPNFQTPYVQQASFGVEREVAHRLAVGATYLYVRGDHLIRARDENLPEPEIVEYPVYDESGAKFTGQYLGVPSFSTWQMTKSMDCPYAPCINPLARPVPELGQVVVFESAANSYYNGLTISVRRRMTHGLYFRLGYTWAKAIDDGQDALVAGRPATVQNSYDLTGERGLSSTDQRQRFVFSWTAAPKPFHREHPALKFLFNEWKIAGVITAGSGRPVSARVIGDANTDGNTENDRLPGVARNFYTGPNYQTGDLRISRTFSMAERLKVEFIAESFNVLNRLNQRLEITDDGFDNTAANFVQQDVTAQGKRYPAEFRMSGGFLTPTSAYAPRQMQFALKVKF